MKHLILSQHQTKVVLHHRDYSSERRLLLAPHFYCDESRVLRLYCRVRFVISVHFENDKIVYRYSSEFVHENAEYLEEA